MEQMIVSHLDLAEHQLEDLSRIDESEFDSTFSSLFPVSAQSDCARILELSTNNEPNPSCSSRFVLKSDEQLKEAEANSVPKNMMRNGLGCKYLEAVECTSSEVLSIKIW